jgi:hypothetical protein
MTALLITVAAWLVVVPVLALLLGAIVHGREQQVPGSAEPMVGAAAVGDMGTAASRSSSVA